MDMENLLITVQWMDNWAQIRVYADGRALPRIEEEEQGKPMKKEKHVTFKEEDGIHPYYDLTDEELEPVKVNMVAYSED